MDKMNIQKTTEIVAHRGVHNSHPENTIPAFEEAVKEGADAVELDVRLSADGVPVIYHYYYLDELTTLSGPVFNFTYKQLKQARFTNPDTSELDICIPSLAEALELFAGRIGLEIEIKGPEPKALGVVCNLLCDFRHAWDSVEITSYEPMHLVEIRENCPGIATDMLVPHSEPWMGSDVLAYQSIHRARMAGARAVHLHPTQLTRQLADDIRNSGIGIHAWDLNTTDDWEIIHSLGIPKVNTDNLASIMKLVGRR